MDPNTKPDNVNSDLLTDVDRSRRLVEKLNYLTATRPSISSAMSVVT